ncbi:transglycosylase domain-containing protein [Nocardioides sp.]|uniref:transglycosylase domain-containing protein n=1 Tax=Nocardioides sp. TaxID=35761 RepID=UPI0035165EBD
MDGKRKAAGTPATGGRGASRPAQGSRAVWKRRLLRTAKWGGISSLVLALVGVAGFVFLYKSIDIPAANAEFLTETTFVYYDDGETELGRFENQFRDSISLDEMPDTLKEAVVAAENRTFWTDSGIDPKGILRALFNNVAGGSRQGASTITQQYVKILYLSQEQSYKRKVKEAILSLKVQREFSKSEVLENYLNLIYFGRGAYGVEAAANVYFDKDAADLDLRESAVLAALLNDPNDLDPSNGRDARIALRGRYDYVLDSMVETGDLTASEAERAKKRLPDFPEQKAEDAYGGQRGHMLTLVRNQLLKLPNYETGELFTEEEINGGGLRITTTLNRKMMDNTIEGVKAMRPEGVGDKQLHVGAATVEPGTGALKAFFAGQDYLKSQLNWAVLGGQAGSTFKPFAVAAALKAGFSIKDTFDGNSPYETPDGIDFENQGDTDYGSRVSLIQATEDSINTAFIDLTLAMPDGPQEIIDTAVDMGIPPEKVGRKDPFGIPTETGGLEPNTGVALGSQTVSPINMANAYATIANGGMRADPYVVEKVTDASGTVLYQHRVEEQRAISADVAADVAYAMQQVIVAGSGSISAPLADGRPAAGKTGTATKTGGAVSSSWFAGFTPQYSTAVMYVRGDGNGQLDGWLPTSSDGREGYFGGNYPAKTWNAIMNADHEGLPILQFPDPVYVDGDAPSEGHEPYTPPPPKPTKDKDTESPTEEPTDGPTDSPTDSPTDTPTDSPTDTPTDSPTDTPTTEPTCGLLGCSGGRRSG